ncbi:MAG: aspartate aminotransferase family protein, partial [Anaerolineae bacterium]|nr:aspartate aminotransferase family protein [Anaerolineae bacterium]
WQQGRVFGLVYHISEEIDNLLKEAFTMFFSENGLNPAAFPSLGKFEREVVSMTASLLNGDEKVCGNMTTGGTESLLMAVKVARDWARIQRPEITTPEIVMPVTAHPAFDKAGDYFNVKIVHVPVQDDYRANIDAMRQAISRDTIMMVGSAPSYPHGVVDPISALAAIAQEHGLLFHTDSCVGGFMLPFIRKLGYAVPAFDFSVPGVTSMSADLHKYGYAAKPASVVLYRTPELRRQQMFVAINWPGGIYPSPTMTGSRAGGPIAAAWALMNFLGKEGYLEIANTVMETTIYLQVGIQDIPGLKVLSNPEMSVFAIGSDTLDVYELADELALRGWHLDRQHFPTCLHMTVNYMHAEVKEEFLLDLEACAEIVRKPSTRKTVNRLIVQAANGAAHVLPKAWMSRLMEKVSGVLGGSGSGLPSRMAPMYGLIGSLPNRGDLKEMVLDLLDSMTRPM